MVKILNVESLTPTVQCWDNFIGVVAGENESASAVILLHYSAQSRLDRITIMNNYTITNKSMIVFDGKINYSLDSRWGYFFDGGAL